MRIAKQLLLDRVLCLDWYDGPTRGVARSFSADLSVEFHQIAVDKDVDRRLFAFHHTSGETFEKVVAICSRWESPRWPNWVFKWDIGSDEALQALAKELDASLNLLSPPVFICLCSSHDIGAKDLQLYELPAEAQTTVPLSVAWQDVNAWTDYLG